MAKKESSSMAELNYELAFAELEKVVCALEDKQNSLEESMKLFERGQVLVKRCTDLLNNAELKVQELSKSAGEGG